METLKERRKALGLRLQDLAEQSGVSYGTCWNFEHGREGRAIMENYLKVVSCLDRIEKERKEATKEKEPC